MLLLISLQKYATKLLVVSYQTTGTFHATAGQGTKLANRFSKDQSEATLNWTTVQGQSTDLN